MDTGRDPASVAVGVGEGRRAARRESATWSPLTAWKLQNLYGPVVQAIRAILAETELGDQPPHILQLGGQPDVLQPWLAADEPPFEGRVSWIAAGGDRLPVAPDQWDIVVAFDWLPDVAASQRERVVVDACRRSKRGVVFVNVFDNAVARTTARHVNDLYRAVHGGDHPLLGRGLEIGFPDAEAVQGWCERSHLFVQLIAIEDAATWHAAEAMTIARGPVEPAASDADVAAAAIYPASGAIDDRAVAFRLMLIASPTPVAVRGLSPEAAASWPTAVAMLAAAETAAQRATLDALVAAITTDREREREEFRSALASLAADIRELDGRAEFLSREVRARDQIIADQHMRIAALSEARAESPAAPPPPAPVVATAPALSEEEARELTELRGKIALLAHDADAYRRFLSSRAGRLLRQYTRLKQTLRR